jgi:hypothetical protein
MSWLLPRLGWMAIGVLFVVFVVFIQWPRNATSDRAGTTDAEGASRARGTTRKNAVGAADGSLHWAPAYNATPLALRRWPRPEHVLKSSVILGDSFCRKSPASRAEVCEVSMCHPFSSCKLLRHDWSEAPTLASAHSTGDQVHSMRIIHSSPTFFPFFQAPEHHCCPLSVCTSTSKRQLLSFHSRGCSLPYALSSLPCALS